MIVEENFDQWFDTVELVFAEIQIWDEWCCLMANHSPATVGLSKYIDGYNCRQRRSEEIFFHEYPADAVRAVKSEV